jgi:hypothetical protein
MCVPGAPCGGTEELQSHAKLGSGPAEGCMPPPGFRPAPQSPVTAFHGRNRELQVCEDESGR